MSDLLDTVLASPEQPYVLLHRPHSRGPGGLEVLVGDVVSVPALADVPLPGPEAPNGPQALVVVPFRQVTERGLACVDDHAPLLVMNVREHAVLPKTSACERLPDDRLRLEGAEFDVDDAAYAEIVRRVITDEIGGGEGANFVVRRSFLAEIQHYHAGLALSFFRRLCAQESGYHWAFVLHTGDRTFVGASPERHVSLAGGVVTMNPISGTYRYPAGGPHLVGRARFPGRPQRDRRALHGARRRAQDDVAGSATTACGWWGPGSRRWPGSRTPSTSSREAAVATPARSCTRPCSPPRSRAARWRTPAA